MKMTSEPSQILEPKPLVIGPDKLEALRLKLMITRKDMASLLGVSRVTYHGWLSGNPIGKRSQGYVLKVLRRMVALIKDHGWPRDEVAAMNRYDRRKYLDSLLSQYE